MFEDVGDVVWGLEGEFDIGLGKCIGETSDCGDGKCGDELVVANKDRHGGG